MSNILFIGDSLTSGDNNRRISYVNYINFGEVVNLGVSGTTIGEYSIYPVDGYSLLSQIKYNEIFVQQADEIYLEFGANDVSAIITGNVSYTQVIISFVKAIDYIKQLNPEAKIFFLVLSFDKNFLKYYSALHVNYLINDYFKSYSIVGSAKDWYETYQRLICDIDKKVSVIPLFLGNEMLDNLDKDNIHPNDEGYKIAAKNIEKYREVFLENESVDNWN